MKIRIKSFDAHHEMFDSYETAKMVEKKNHHGQVCIYTYTTELGKHYIHKYKDYISIIRTGKIYLKQLFKLSQKTTMTYRAYGDLIEYEIFTKHMELNDKKIFLEYDIMINDEIINTITLEIVLYDKERKEEE